MSQRFFVVPSLFITSALVVATSGAAQGIGVDWRPTAREVVLNTEFAQVQTSGGMRAVRGGVFVFRNVTIPRGVTVRGAGKNPLVIIAAGKIDIQGAISVRGGNGQRVDTLNSANFPSRGGVGVCGGGDGGMGSPSTTRRSVAGQAGFGPFGLPLFGGKGGSLSCVSSCRQGSGGGGGSFATVGDPQYKVAPTTNFVQPRGIGAFGCTNRTSTVLPGGAAGARIFGDGRPGNDFFGIGVDLNQGVFVRGELPILVGGSGGGGGGDYALSCTVNSPTFVNDEKGGGGGAGGGVLVLASTGGITIGPQARVDADGGHGGGGAWAGSSNRAAGGGGGSGGLVALWTQTSITIHVQGETYANNDYRFPVSADGGVCLRSPYGGSGREIRGKYDPAPHTVTSTILNQSPTGGFGGMGILQFMAPVARNQDGTNTILDDSIILISGNQTLRGAAKQRYLGWRGFPDQAGTWRDDRGAAVTTGIGDFRPRPVLMPVF